MEKYKSINEIASDYSNGIYSNQKPFPKQTKYKDGHIFDENQTVKWNKEEVQRRNDEIIRLRDEYDNESNSLSDKLRDDVIYNLIYDYDLTQAQAEMTYDNAYSDKHSSMNDVFYYAANLAEYYKKMMIIKG